MFTKGRGVQNPHDDHAYLNPETHEPKFSADAFGNVQRWFAYLVEIYISLCEIDGDETWKAKKPQGTEDNINSIVARIMIKLRKLQEDKMIGRQSVAKLESALRAMSPIAKMIKKDDDASPDAEVKIRRCKRCKGKRKEQKEKERKTKKTFP